MIRPLCIALVATAGLLLSSRAGAQVCNAPDANSANMIADIIGMVTSADSDEVARRDMYGLPAAAASSVLLVTDEKTCAKARDAYNASLPAEATFTATAVYVVVVGSGSSKTYAVRANQSTTASEFQLVAVFDAKFTFKEAFSQ